MPSTMESTMRSCISRPLGATGTARLPPIPSVRPIVPDMSSSPLALLHGVPIAADSHKRRTVAKELICSKGDAATRLFFILAGHVKVSASSEDGKEITFAILGPGELFGEIALIEGTKHSASVISLEPTELLTFDRRDFLALLRDQPSLALSLLTTVCARLRSASELALARSHGIASGPGIRIGLHVCQQELANMVGATRESVNKQLAIWLKEGLIATRKGYLTITHLETFAARHRLWNP